MRIPTNWHDITIGRFIAARESTLCEYDNDLDREIAFICAVTGCDESEVLKLKRTELVNLVEKLSFISDLDSIGTQWPKYFAIRGRIFKPLQDVRKATAGVYIDLSHYTKGTPDEIIRNLHNIMATVCRETILGIPLPYNGEKHAKLAEFFKEHMPFSIAYPIAVFFCNLYEHLIPATRSYLEMEIVKQTEMAMKAIRS